MIFNISEAKTKLSKLVNMAYHGEKVVIAKNNLPPCGSGNVVKHCIRKLNYNCRVDVKGFNWKIED